MRDAILKTMFSYSPLVFSDCLILMIICLIFGIPEVISKRLVKYEGKNRGSIKESLHKQFWEPRQKINTTLCSSEVTAATGAAC